MNLEELLRVPVPMSTRTYKPVSHRSIINTTNELLRDAGYDYELSFNTASNGQIVVGTYKIGWGDFTRSLSFSNSYNKKIKVGFATGTVTQVCANGMLWGENIFHKKHMGDVRAELKGMIQDEVNNIEVTYNEVMRWFNELRAIKMSKMDMAEMSGRLFIEEEIINTVQITELRTQILKPSYDYGGLNDTLYSFYQHCTHSIKKSHPSNVFKTNQKLINFVKKLT